MKVYGINRLSTDTADQQHNLKELAALQALHTMLSTRINEALAGKVSTKSVSQILDEELVGEWTVELRREVTRELTERRV